MVAHPSRTLKPSFGAPSGGGRTRRGPGSRQAPDVDRGWSGHRGRLWAHLPPQHTCGHQGLGAWPRPCPVKRASEAVHVLPAPSAPAGFRCQSSEGLKTHPFPAPGPAGGAPGPLHPRGEEVRESRAAPRGGGARSGAAGGPFCLLTRSGLFLRQGSQEPLGDRGPGEGHIR